MQAHTLISLGLCMHLWGHHTQETGLSITSISFFVPLHSPSLLLLPLPQFSWLALKSGSFSLCSFSGCSMSLMSFMNTWNIVIINFSCLQILTFASVLDYLMTLLLIVSLIFLHLCSPGNLLDTQYCEFCPGKCSSLEIVCSFHILLTGAVLMLGAVTLERWGKTHLSALSDDLCLRRFSVLPVGMGIISGSEWRALILPGDSLVTLGSCDVHGLVFSWMLEGGWGSVASLRSSLSTLLFHPVFCPANPCHLVLPGLSALLTTERVQ